MSRARPTDKQRLVQLLQKHGEVVAVTGDGTNDAPALNHAHVGLSLGSGTSVAKQASDITLLDDNFHSIANAVMWGNSLYKNIQRFLFFQACRQRQCPAARPRRQHHRHGNAAHGDTDPLGQPDHGHLCRHGLASLPPSREVMKDKPRKPSDFIISKSMGRGILGCGIVFFAIMFVFLIWCERHGAGSIIDVHELTLFFTTFVMLQFWNLFNAKCLGCTQCFPQPAPRRRPAARVAADLLWTMAHRHLRRPHVPHPTVECRGMAHHHDSHILGTCCR